SPARATTSRSRSASVTTMSAIARFAVDLPYLPCPGRKTRQRMGDYSDFRDLVAGRRMSVSLRPAGSLVDLDAFNQIVQGLQSGGKRSCLLPALDNLTELILEKAPVGKQQRPSDFYFSAVEIAAAQETFGDWGAGRSIRFQADRHF